MTMRRLACENARRLQFCESADIDGQIDKEGEISNMKRFQSLTIIIVIALVLVALGFIITLATDVFVFENRLIILDENGLAIYELNGNKLFSTPTDGFARILTAKDRLILIDNSGIRLFDLNGTQQGSTITTNRPPRVLPINDNLVIVDKNRIRVFDLSAIQRGGDIATEGAVSVKPTGDGFMVIDGEDRFRIYSLDGVLLSTVQLPTGQHPVVTSIDFPGIVPSSRTPATGSFEFEDQNGDVDFAFISAVEAKSFISAGFVTQVSGTTKGTIGFTITCLIPQAITASITLVDKEHHTSIPKEFSFVCQ